MTFRTSTAMCSLPDLTSLTPRPVKTKVYKARPILLHLSSGLSFSYLTNLLSERHIKASSDFAERILGDHHHSLHDELSKARSHTSTRSRFKLLLSNRISELCPPGVIATPGQLKRGAEPSSRISSRIIPKHNKEVLTAPDTFYCSL